MITIIKQGNAQFVTSTALLFGLRKEDDMNGWIEPQSTQDYRTMRRALNEDACNLYLRQTTEAEADALHDCIEHAELLDTQPDADENLFDEPVQISHRPDEFSAAIEDGCGTDSDLYNYSRGG